MGRDLVAEAITELTGRPVRRRVVLRPGARRLGRVEVGDGATVVLVAGSGEMCLDHAPLLPRLAASARVVAHDRAGAGDSDPVRPLTLDGSVDDLVAVLRDTGPAVVVGHSWGGLLVQLAAREAPDLVRGLVLVDPSHEAVLAGLPRHLRLAERWLFGGLVLLDRVGLFGRLAASHGRALATTTTDDPALRDLVVAAYLRSYSRHHQVVTIRDEARLAQRSVDTIVCRRAAKDLPDVPLVVLSATDKPTALREASLAVNAAVAASVPRGRHVVVEGSGHYVHHDRPAAVHDAVDEVLAALG